MPAPVPWTFFSTPDSRVLEETAHLKFNKSTEETSLDDRRTAVRAFTSRFVKSGMTWSQAVVHAFALEQDIFNAKLDPLHMISYRDWIECSYRSIDVPDPQMRLLCELAYDAAWYAAPSDLQEQIKRRPREYSARDFLMAAGRK